MESHSSGAAFAAANAAMLRGVDSASTVHVLLADCLLLLGAESAGVLVHVDGTGLEVLAATSHAAQSLELYQELAHSGPCVETIDTGRSVAVTGADELVDRWPDFSRVMSSVGYQAVLASPMRWHDLTLGGLNLFWTESTSLTSDQHELAQAFADICTLALMQSPGEDAVDLVRMRLRTALQGRVVIERAKGVLAESEGLEMAAAFDRLVQTSRQSSTPLADVAQSVLEAVVSPRAGQ